MSIDRIHTRSLKHFECSSQIAESEHKPAHLKLYWYTGDTKYANINLPPAFIQELRLSIEDEVTAELITISDGRKGILLLKEEGQSRN